MGSKSSSRTQLAEWRALAQHAETMGAVHLRELFAQDPARGERLALEFAGLYFDYSKHRVTDETLRLLTALARACGLEERRDAMYAGERSDLAPSIVPLAERRRWWHRFRRTAR